MMTSSSTHQYLRPEYLTPLPTTLDAKKSPLALLAQTCSQIGADSTNTKLFQTADNKSTAASVNRKSENSPKDVSPNSNCSTGSRSSPHSNRENHHQSHNNGHKKSSPSSTPEKHKTAVTRTGDLLQRSKTPQNSKIFSSTSTSCRSDSNVSASSTPPNMADRKSSSPVDEDSHKSSTDQKLSPSPPTSCSSSSAKSAFTPNISSSFPLTTTTVSPHSEAILKDLPLGTYKPTLPYSYLTPNPMYPTFPLPMDIALLSHAMKSGLSPYLNYARPKLDSAPPTCQDPYCTGCVLGGGGGGGAGGSHMYSARNTKTSSCPTGCTHCSDHKIHQHAPSYYGGFNPAQPYVCNWISADSSYCGKRFTSSEELLVHLRTHTTSASYTSEANTLPVNPSSIYSSVGLHPLLIQQRQYAAAAAAAAAAQSFGSLSAVPRFHPYGKPPPGLISPSPLAPSPLASSATAFPPLSALTTHPSLSSYLSSPYSLYGSRLGATLGMHP